MFFFYSHTELYKITTNKSCVKDIFHLAYKRVTLNYELRIFCGVIILVVLKSVVTSTLSSNSLLAHYIAERVAGRSDIMQVQI
jgi:hypothetical protein